MCMSSELLDSLTNDSPDKAWQAVRDYLWQTFSATLPSGKCADAEIVNRDRGINELENALSSSCWDLWRSFESAVPRASEAVVEYWNRIHGGKAVLILDGLSLRESPWLLEQATARGYTIHHSGAYASELPSETNHFAKALGLSQRAALENNGAGKAHKLTGAFTETNALPWSECAAKVGAQESIVYWHHWPDERVHELAKPGEGLKKLAAENHAVLNGDEFWSFVEKLAHGRRVIITSDHGYAACGYFSNLDGEQAAYMKQLFASGRTAAKPNPSVDTQPAAWLPPIDIELDTQHGTHRFVLGRRNWKVSGQNNRLLAHGGLSLLEVFVPFIELSR
ncbi:MAG: hypothetical protein IT422_22485 [Pirellulaceae bacterium]|nr:hypothetical protein [Pirellulaceae bacterium]